MEAVVEKECRICGGSGVRPERSVCDVCLGFVERIEESQLGMSSGSENMIEQPRRGFTCGRCGTMWAAEHFDAAGNLRIHPKNKRRICCWNVAMKNARQQKVKVKESVALGDASNVDDQELQTVEQEAPEPQVDLRICDDCKGEFIPYRRGCATVTNVCRKCLQKKIAEMNLEKGSMAKAIRDGFAGGFILLDMRKYMPEMQKLAALAEEQLRSLKAQALWILVDAVRKAKARGVE